MKKKMLFKNEIANKTTVIEVNVANKLHFDVQRNTRAQVFVNRKKRAKNGYSKHKGGNY